MNSAVEYVADFFRRSRHELVMPDVPSCYFAGFRKDEIGQCDINHLTHGLCKKSISIQRGTVSELMPIVSKSRFDCIIVKSVCRKELSRLVNVCAVYSTFVFVNYFNDGENDADRFVPLSLSYLVSLMRQGNRIILMPTIYFISKMPAYAYFNEAPYKIFVPCIIENERDLNRVVFCKEANDVSGGKMVVGMIKDNLRKQAERGMFLDDDLNFCIVGMPSILEKTETQLFKCLADRYDVGSIIGIGEDVPGLHVKTWGEGYLLPENLNEYLIKLLRHSNEAILKYLGVYDEDGRCSVLCDGKRLALYSVTLGQYIPSQHGCCTFACYYLDECKASPDKVIQVVNALYASMSSYVLRDAKVRFDRQSLRSAVGSIMSRNGSHNIGSHVLAALSHNVGTMPDDRVLYQYIQHRMDYIATVTTDFPTWSQPTMLVGGMIKSFLTQRHLLNYIASSEGLKAWQYQNENIGKQSACICLHVRRIEGGVCNEDRKIVADFFADVCDPIDLEHDICLAIPGGVVGQHAFFTIIENLIRNAAKHDWSTPPESTKKFKYQRRERVDADGEADTKDSREHPDTEIYETETVDDRKVLKVVGNLDVYIDFEDKPEEGNVEFVVYTNMSDTEVAPGSGGQSLVQSIQASLDEPIIDNETGMLRRTNWGLAEMKISCGYLQGREIGEIGGLAGKSDRVRKNEKRFGPILTARAVKTNREDPVKHLGYTFKVPKPRTLLLITQNEITPEIQKKFPKLAEYGVYVKSICRQPDKNVVSVSKEELGAEFVLLDSFGRDCYSWKLPFRVVAMRKDDSEPTNLLAKWSSVGNAFSEPLARKTTVDEVIDFVVNGDKQRYGMKPRAKDDIESRAKEVIAHVAACWTRYVCKRHCPNPDSEQRVNLVVVPTTKSGSGEQGSGRSLVNPASVASYVFDEGFDAAVSSYEHLHGIDSGSSGEKAVCYSVLEHLRKLKPRVVKSEYRKSDWGYEEFVQKQIVDWLGNLKIDNVDCREVSDYLELKLEEKTQEDLKKVKRSLGEIVARINAGERSPDLLATKKSLILKRNELTGRTHETAREARHYFETFVAYFVEVCKQAKVYLGKYAEDVATVPQSFKNLNNVAGKDRNQGKPQHWDAGGLTFYRTEQVVSRAGDVTVEYIRHFSESEGVVREPKLVPKFVTDPFVAHPGVKYIEALSGTQSYLSQLQMMKGDDYITQSKLMENALMRILIVDERVAKFIKDHSDVMLATYSRLNLTVVDDKWMEDALKLDVNSCDMGRTPRGLLTLNVSAIKALNEELKRPKVEDFKDAFLKSAGLVECYSKQFDIVIVHQGIIDKWFPDIAHDPERVTWLYWAMKKLFPYVIITTGRGTPANIPNWARVLPFSTIESTLFKKYPEKLLLVDAIMNILPLSKS